MGFPNLLTIIIYSHMAYCGQETLHLRAPCLTTEIDVLVLSLVSGGDSNKDFKVEGEDLVGLESKNAFFAEYTKIGKTLYSECIPTE